MVSLWNPRLFAYVLLAAAILFPAFVLIRALDRVRVVGEGKGLIVVVFFLSIISAFVLAVANLNITAAYREAAVPRPLWLRVERAMFRLALVAAALPALAFLALLLLRGMN
jgi:hypothetical protein